MKHRICLIGLLLVFCFMQLTIVAQPIEIYDIKNKKFYRHLVQKDETLYSIAEFYDITRKQIVEENKISLLGLYVGQELLVPLEAKQQFIYHPVKKGETAFGLANKYGIEEADIYRYNPKAKEKILIGEVLKIPQFSIPKLRLQETDDFYYHQAKAGESLADIAKQYDSQTDILRQINATISGQVSAGDVVRIPKNPEQVKDYSYIVQNKDSTDNISHDPLFLKNPALRCDTFHYEENPYAFRIGLLLPFFLDKNELMGYSGLIDDDEKLFYHNSERFIEMYEGILMALDTLRRSGIYVNLHVYDTKRDSATVTQIVEKPELKTMDLIIGPVYAPNIQIVGEFAYENKIPVVSPLLPFPKKHESFIVQSLIERNTNILPANPYIFQAKPSITSGVKTMAKYLTNFSHYNLLLVTEAPSGIADSLQHEQITNLYITEIRNAFAARELTDSLRLSEFMCKENKFYKIKDSLLKERPNIVIVPETNEVFASGLLNTLFSLSESYNIMLFGMAEWENYQNIETQYLHDFRFHYYTNTYIDYNRLTVKDFIRKTRKIYKYEPSSLTFQGYDITFYFCQLLKMYGPEFQYCIDAPYQIPGEKGMSVEFDFQRTDIFGGFENKSVHLVKYGDEFSINKVDSLIIDTLRIETDIENENFDFD